MMKKPDNRDLEQKMLAMASKIVTVNMDAFAPPQPTIEIFSPNDAYVCKVLNIKTPNPLNNRQHWRVEYAKSLKHLAEVKRQFASVDECIRLELSKGCVVRLTRGSAGKLADDALPGALKHVRDGIAAWLLGGNPGERDDDPCITWQYDQIKLKRKEHKVVVNITRK